MMKSRISFTCTVLLTLFTFPSTVCLAQKPELVVETGHSESVTALAFSSDGKRLVSSDHTTIKVWDLPGGREVRTLAGHTAKITSLALSSDGRLLASGSNDKTIKLWDLNMGREVSTLSGHSAAINSLAFTPNGKFLASGGKDKLIKLWDLNDGQSRTLLPSNRKPVHIEPLSDLLSDSMIGPLGIRSLSFSADGSVLASGSADGLIELWKSDSGTKIRTLGHSGDIRSLAFCPDGSVLASGSSDTKIKLWDLVSGAERTLQGHSEGVTAVAFSADGQKLASTSGEAPGDWGLINLSKTNKGKSIKLWDVRSGLEIYSADRQDLLSYVAAFSADGKTLALGTKEIELWDVAAGRISSRITAHSRGVDAVAFSVDGKALAAGSSGVKLWQLGTDAEPRNVGDSSTNVSWLAFTDSGTLLVGDSSKIVEVPETTAGRSPRSWKRDMTLTRSAALSTDGKTLARATGNQIELWDLSSNRELRALPIPSRSFRDFQGRYDNGIESLSLSADGGMVAYAATVLEPIIKVYDTETWRELISDVGYEVAFSPVGKTLAAATTGGSIKFRDITTGREWHTVKGSDYAVALAFAPNGKTMASGYSSYIIKLWEVETGRELRTLSGHSSYIKSLAFSKDGMLMVSGSMDGTAKLWRVANGELMATLIALDEDDWAIVTPQGHFDASANGQKLMHWNVGSESVDLAQLKARYYQPGLLAKLFKGERLRDVGTFENPKLYPEVKLEPPRNGSNTLAVTLTNRGGGIGRVQVFVNNKEFLEDARDEKLKRNPDVRQATLNVDLSKAPSTIKGVTNNIRVVAWNVENYISSRGDEKPWVAEGVANKEPPEVYAIVAGIHQYAGSKLNLRFAGKDAVDMGNAIELGAKRLFGADKVHLTLLTTYKDPRAIAPTKENFTKAFSALINQAKPKDILIVYLAGHAITFQHSGSDTYCYLTQEADSTDVSDPAVRKQRTVTSDDLREWIKQVPANKQAVILDTCAAGAAQDPFIAAARAALATPFEPLSWRWTAPDRTFSWGAPRTQRLLKRHDMDRGC